MSKYEKMANQFAIVHKANKIILGGITVDINNTRQELTALCDTIDKLLIDDANVHELKRLLDEVDDPNVNIRLSVNSHEQNQNDTNMLLSSDWNSIVHASRNEIESYGLDSNQISFNDLLSQEENIAIQQQLDRPLYDRIPWDKWDYIFAFGTGLVGGVLDIFLGTPGKGLQAQMADKSTWIGSQMEKIHSYHATDAAVDYLGSPFGGTYHRILSPGHDLFRPFEGIRQFKDGVFRGYYWKDGQKFLFESFTNKNGKLYAPIDSWGDAILAWMAHMICDFFSTTSLPIPGSSYFREIDYRELRIFIKEDLYECGINLRHLILQTIAPLFIEVLIRAFIYLRYNKKSLDPNAIAQKRLELLTVGHSISTGFNCGKVIIMKNPLLINIPQVMALSKNLIKLILQERKRNSFFNKVERNLKDLRETQQQFEDMIEKELSVPIILS